MCLVSLIMKHPVEEDMCLVSGIMKHPIKEDMFSLKNNETPWRRRCKPQSNLLYTILINLIGFPQEENKRKDQSVELGDYKEKPLGKVKD